MANYVYPAESMVKIAILNIHFALETLGICNCPKFSHWVKRLGGKEYQYLSPWINGRQ